LCTRISFRWFTRGTVAKLWTGRHDSWWLECGAQPQRGVEVTMARERIDSRAEAREAREKYHEEAVMYLAPRTHAGPKGTFGVAGTGMDGIEVDPQALIAADRELDRLHRRLLDHLRDADKLADQLHDGKTLVSRHMRRKFLDKVEAEGGLKAALEDYLDELKDVQIRVRESLAAYQDLDTDGAARIRSQGVD
jgi:hypothetical protein